MLKLFYISSREGLQAFQFLEFKDELNPLNSLVILSDAIYHLHPDISTRVLKVSEYSLPESKSVKNLECLIVTPIDSLQKSLSEIRQLEEQGLNFKILPSHKYWKSSKFLKSLEGFTSDTILKYAPLRLNQVPQFRINEGSILITGAAGSIGAELCRSLSKFPINKIIAFDQSESGLYHLINSIDSTHRDKVEIVLGSILDENLLKSIFNQNAISTVYHLAAYKHVNLLESQPEQAYNTNIGGTKLLFNTAKKYDTQTFIFASTDKAVEPKSIMGLTKQLAEDFLLNSEKPENLQVIISRFGNILESEGSVVQNFELQYKNTNTIRVNSEKMHRYFLLKEDAIRFLIWMLNSKEDKATYLYHPSEHISIAQLGVYFLKLKGEITPQKLITTGSKSHAEKYNEKLIGDNEVAIKTEQTDISKITTLSSQLQSKKSFT